jgi:phenylalanyl-tRNA synthetase alpha chain
MNNIEQIKSDYTNKINSAATSAELETIRIELLGRNGLINKLFSEIKSAKNPKEYGALLNSLKNDLENLINNKHVIASEAKQSRSEQNKTISLPKVGHLHPISITERQLNEVFRKLDFSVYNGPEIVSAE